jgi:cobalt-zinc-cadmium efflux system outer membrane protein
MAPTNQLDQLVLKALERNSGLKSLTSRSLGENELAGSQWNLPDPKLSYSSLDRGNRTYYVQLSQQIDFPMKYSLQEDVQEAKAFAADQSVRSEKLKLKQKVITTFYAIYSNQRLAQLVNANIASVKEAARVAEKKYAAGLNARSDSMKAHFELTNLELELIRLQEAEVDLQEQMRALLADQGAADLNLGAGEFPIPEFRRLEPYGGAENIWADARKTSPVVKEELFKLDAANSQSELSDWEYAPNLQMSYQKRVRGYPKDSEMWSIGISVPLWAWKQNGNSRAAAQFKQAQSHKVDETLQQIVARVKNRKQRVESAFKTLKIYQTSLIPQAEGAYSSARSAYAASKTSFLDLLDSERSLLRVKAGYYRTLSQYVADLCQLETDLGISVSNLTNDGVGL